ncbi:Uncharacterized protein SCF082_LOCUS50038 [Durusdinium trenchii]|uniref:Protein HGH1 homolog n=1 Tax=Durusdinium trenchii TaxID=1381693 RepID=A0ABP0S540_9DINO
MAGFHAEAALPSRQASLVDSICQAVAACHFSVSLAQHSKVDEQASSKKKKEEKPQPTVDRKLALLKLRDVASSSLREVLWQDSEVREILLAGLDETQPELARVLSLGVLVHLTTSRKNCSELLKNEQVRLSLSQLQSEGQPQEVQEKALLALVALAIPAFQDCQEISEDLRDVLGKAAARNRDNAQRLLVFRALWSVSTVCDSPELFFGNDKIWESLLQSLQQEEDLDVRESGLGLLSALANQQTTAHFLWGDVDDEDDPQGERVREDIFANTLRSQPARIRGRALAVLAGIVRDPQKRPSVWNYVSTASVSEDLGGFFHDTEMSKGHEVDLGARRPRSTSSDASGRRERKGSDASATSKKSAEEQEARVEAAERATMKDSIMAAAARTELPSVRSPALRILLELSWDETLKMSLIENNIPELLLDAWPDQRLGLKERKLCKHGHRRLVDWNKARIAEELRIERENERREQDAMQFEEDFQVGLKLSPNLLV